MKALGRLLAVILLALVILRALLPALLKSAINHRLRALEGYEGRVEGVRPALFRGGARLEGFHIRRKSAPELPFLDVDGIDASIDWKPLLKGRVVVEVLIDKPILHVNRTDLEEGKNKSHATPPLTGAARRVIPVKIERLELRDGSFSYVDPDIGPSPAFQSDRIEVLAVNLTNSRALSDDLFADVRASARLMGSGDFRLAMKAAPALVPPAMKMEFTLRGLDLRGLNGIFRSYGKLDVQAGTFAMAGEIAVREGKIDGYVRPALENVKVFSWKADVKEQKKPPLRVAWEGIVELVKDAARRRKPDQVATRIPIKGAVTDPHTDVATVAVNVMRNAFLKAILPLLEHSVHL